MLWAFCPTIWANSLEFSRHRLRLSADKMYRACELKDQTCKKTRTLHLSDTELFAPPPAFTWKTPTPPEDIQTPKNCLGLCSFFFCAWFAHLSTWPCLSWRHKVILVEPWSKVALELLCGLSPHAVKHRRTPVCTTACLGGPMSKARDLTGPNLIHPHAPTLKIPF